MKPNSPTLLNKRTVDACKPVEKRYEVWDQELSGFGLRVSPNGTKTYILRYRPGGGGRNAPKRYVTIGRHGILTPDQARTMAKKTLGAVLNGADPAKELKDRRNQHTIKTLFELYCETGSVHLKDKTRRYTLARLRNHAIPLLGTKALGEISVKDVEKMISDVSVGKTAKVAKQGTRHQSVVKGGPGAAAKVARDLSAMFTFGIREGFVNFNPCLAARKPKDGSRHRYLTEQEVFRLGAALDEVERSGANRMATDIIRLLLLTGCRRDEIVALRWLEVDFERSCLRLDDSKTGKSVRPLSTAAIQILIDQRRSGDSQYVFPSVKGPTAGQGHYQGVKRVWTQVRKIARLEDVVLHTFRHTLASASVSSGETLAMTGAILGHKNSRSTDVYAHVANDPAKLAADRVSYPLLEALHRGEDSNKSVG